MRCGLALGDGCSAACLASSIASWLASRFLRSASRPAPSAPLLLLPAPLPSCASADSCLDALRCSCATLRAMAAASAFVLCAAAEEGPSTCLRMTCACSNSVAALSKLPSAIASLPPSTRARACSRPCSLLTASTGGGSGDLFTLVLGCRRRTAQELMYENRAPNSHILVSEQEFLPSN